MRYLICLFILFPIGGFAVNLQNCSASSIEQIITGPKHGALINLVDNECGNNGYVCLDIEGEYSSKEKSRVALAFLFTSYATEKRIQVTVDLDIKPASCNGNYPMIDDIRTP